MFYLACLASLLVSLLITIVLHVLFFRRELVGALRVGMTSYSFRDSERGPHLESYQQLVPGSTIGA